MIPFTLFYDVSYKTNKAHFNNLNFKRIFSKHAVSILYLSLCYILSALSCPSLNIHQIYLIIYWNKIKLRLLSIYIFYPFSSQLVQTGWEALATTSLYTADTSVTGKIRQEFWIQTFLIFRVGMISHLNALDVKVIPCFIRCDYFTMFRLYLFCCPFQM